MLNDKVTDKKAGAVKKNSGKIVVGYDVGNAYAQISYGMMGEDEPETVATVAGTERYNIPMILCKRDEVNQWFYGREAIKYAEEGGGVKVENLLSLARIGEPVVIGDESFDPVALLTLFIKRSLSLLGLIASPDYIDGIMFTMDNLDKRMVEVFIKVASNLSLKTKKIFFQSHVESFYYFTLNQQKQLWNYGVLLCDYDGEVMKIYTLDSNHNTTPVVLYINVDEYPEMKTERSNDTDCLEDMEKHKLDMQFLEIAKDKCKGLTVSSVYLIGEGYKEEWAADSLRYLCMGRRVFQGNNLYSKGACYGIREKLGISTAGKEYVFLGLDKVRANIGMKVLRRGIDSYFAVIDAGTNWFEAKSEFDVILEDGDSISIILTPLDGKEPREINMILDGLPVRPKRTTRLHLDLEMTSENKLSIKVIDRGFGELFPATDGEWIKLFDI